MFLNIFNRISDLTLREILQHLTVSNIRKVGKNRLVPPPAPCVFTLSTGRSGTKSLAALGNLAETIFAYHEPLPKLYGLAYLSHLTPHGKQNAAIFREAFLLARNDRFRYACSFGKGYLETSPQATFLAPVILKVVPNVKFIHITRDPRDYVRSGMRRRWYVDHPMDNTRIVPHRQSKQGQVWPNLSPFEKIIWLWEETNIWINRFLSELPQERVLRLRAEDVFAMNPASIESYFRFLNSGCPPPQKIRRVLSKRLNAQTAGDFPEYGQWSVEMRQYIREHIGSTAVGFGYHF
jgi:hypothetical protein